MKNKQNTLKHTSIHTTYSAEFDGSRVFISLTPKENDIRANGDLPPGFWESKRYRDWAASVAADFAQRSGSTHCVVTRMIDRDSDYMAWVCSRPF